MTPQPARLTPRAIWLITTVLLILWTVIFSAAAVAIFGPAIFHP